MGQNVLALTLILFFQSFEIYQMQNVLFIYLCFLKQVIIRCLHHQCQESLTTFVLRLIIAIGWQ